MARKTLSFRHVVSRNLLLLSDFSTIPCVVRGCIGCVEARGASRSGLFRLISTLFSINSKNTLIHVVCVDYGLANIDTHDLLNGAVDPCEDPNFLVNHAMLRTLNK